MEEIYWDRRSEAKIIPRPEKVLFSLLKPTQKFIFRVTEVDYRFHRGPLSD